MLNVPRYSDGLKDTLRALNVGVVLSIGQDLKRTCKVKDVGTCEEQHSDRVDFLVCRCHHDRWYTEKDWDYEIDWR